MNNFSDTVVTEGINPRTWRYIATCLTTGDRYTEVCANRPIPGSAQRRTLRRTAEAVFEAKAHRRKFDQSTTQLKEQSTMHPNQSADTYGRCPAQAKAGGFPRTNSRDVTQYLIWNESDHSLHTRVCHDSFDAAQKEATRLSKLHPENNFVILQKVAVLHSSKPVEPKTKMLDLRPVTGLNTISDLMAGYHIFAMPRA